MNRLFFNIVSYLRVGGATSSKTTGLKDNIVIPSSEKTGLEDIDIPSLKTTVLEDIDIPSLETTGLEDIPSFSALSSKTTNREDIDAPSSKPILEDIPRSQKTHDNDKKSFIDIVKISTVVSGYGEWGPFNSFTLSNVRRNFFWRSLEELNNKIFSHCSTDLYVQGSVGGNRIKKQSAANIITITDFEIFSIYVLNTDTTTSGFCLLVSTVTLPPEYQTTVLPLTVVFTIKQVPVQLCYRICNNNYALYKKDNSFLLVDAGDICACIPASFNDKRKMETALRQIFIPYL
jgi:hypothetical protein